MIGLFKSTCDWELKYTSLNSLLDKGQIILVMKKHLKSKLKGKAIKSVNCFKISPNSTNIALSTFFKLRKV